MKSFLKVAAAAAIVAGTTLTAFGAEFTKGTVKKYDGKAGKVTIVHEELKNLGMPAMTMVFRIGEGVDAGKLKEGKAVEFVADRINGKLTVTEVK